MSPIQHSEELDKIEALKILILNKNAFITHNRTNTNKTPFPFDYFHFNTH